MAGRPPKEKCFAQMLRLCVMEDESEAGIEAGQSRTKLRSVVEKLVKNAMDGDNTAIKEVADRLDGKVPQGLIGGDEDDPPITVIERRIVRSDARD